MTEDRNVLGRASALTVMSAVKPRGVPWLRALFFVGTHVPALLATLRRLSFIHFARWTLVRELPALPRLDRAGVEEARGPPDRVRGARKPCVV